MKRASMAVEEMQHAAVNRDLEVEGGVVETIDSVRSNSQSFLKKFLLLVSILILNDEYE